MFCDSGEFSCLFKNEERNNQKILQRLRLNLHEMSVWIFVLLTFITSLPLKKARSSIGDPVVSRATGPLV